MIVAGLASHFLARRAVRSGYCVFKISVPPLLTFLVIGFYLFVPVAFHTYYTKFYGYQLQPDEAPGPFPLEPVDFTFMGLIFFGFVLLFCYAVCVLFRFLFAKQRPA